MDFNEAKYAIESFHHNGNSVDHEAEDLVLREAVDDYEYFESKAGEDYAFYRPRTRDDGTRVNGGAFKKDDQGKWQNIDYQNFQKRVEDFYSLDIVSDPEIVPEEATKPNEASETKSLEEIALSKAKEDAFIEDFFSDAMDVVDEPIAAGEESGEKLISKKFQTIEDTDFYELSDGSKLTYNTKGSYAYKQEKGSTEWKKINSDELKQYASELENYKEAPVSKPAQEAKTSSEVASTNKDATKLADGTEKNVMFWFTAGYCDPCRQMKDNGTKEKLEAKYNVITIDITQQPEIARQFGVYRIPTFVAVNDKGPVDKAVGLSSFQTLENLAKKAGAEKKD